MSETGKKTEINGRDLELVRWSFCEALEFMKEFVLDQIRDKKGKEEALLALEILKANFDEPEELEVFLVLSSWVASAADKIDEGSLTMMEHIEKNHGDSTPKHPHLKIVRRESS